jgi:hypothetical protein
VGRHHAESLLDAQVKGATHAPGDMPTEGMEVTRYRAPSPSLAFLDLLAGLEGGGPQLLQLLLRGVVGPSLAFLDLLAGLEGGGPQLLQLLLRGVVGRLHSLSLGRRVPHGGPQA